MRYILRACIVRENTESYVDELIRACQYANIDEIMMCEDNVFITAIAQPLEEHKKMANVLKRAVEKCRQNGIKCSFYLKSLVGHFSSRAFVLPYTKFVGLNGEESANEPCLLDEGFARYGAELMGYYASCGFDSMMLDDDFRSYNHCNGQLGCFCDLHVQKTSERFGKKLTRERLIDAMQSFDEESMRIKKCFREITFEGQMAFAKGIEKSVHAVDKNIQIGLMASGVEADQYQGRDIEKLLRAFAGENAKPFIRPPGGAYCDTLGDGLFYGLDVGMQYRRALDDRARYVSEIDVFSPRNIFTKSAKILDLQCRMHALAGYDEFSLNLIDHYGTPPLQSVAYLDTLKKNKTEYDRLYTLVKDKKPRGIGISLPTNYVENLSSMRFGAMGIHGYGQILHKLGLPVCYNEEKVNVVWSEVLSSYSDKEILRLLSKGVILDAEATRILLERGFSEYVGVTFSQNIREACFEQLTDSTENGEYVGLRFPVYTASAHRRENVYALAASSGAKVLTSLVGADGKKLGDCSVYFENKLGGKVFANGSQWTGNTLFYEGKRWQWHTVAQKMFGEELPFFIKDAVSIAPLWYQGENDSILVLYNFGLDEQRPKVRLCGKEQVYSLPPLSFKIIEL